MHTLGVPPCTGRVLVFLRTPPSTRTNEVKPHWQWDDCLYLSSAPAGTRIAFHCAYAFVHPHSCTTLPDCQELPPAKTCCATHNLTTLRHPMQASTAWRADRHPDLYPKVCPRCPHERHPDRASTAPIFLVARPRPPSCCEPPAAAMSMHQRSACSISKRAQKMQSRSCASRGRGVLARGPQGIAERFGLHMAMADAQRSSNTGKVRRHGQQGAYDLFLELTQCRTAWSIAHRLHSGKEALKAGAVCRLLCAPAQGGTAGVGKRRRQSNGRLGRREGTVHATASKARMRAQGRARSGAKSALEQGRGLSLELRRCGAEIDSRVGTESGAPLSIERVPED